MMKWKTLFTLMLLVAAPACVTDPATGQSVPDWDKITAATEEAITTVDTQIPLWAHNPDVQRRLEQLSAGLRLIDGAIDQLSAGGTVTTVEEAVNAAIAMVDEWIVTVDPEAHPDLYASLSGVRALLSLTRIALA